MQNNKRHTIQCSYCANVATTRDHVPAKCLLEKPYPANLLTVPCCERCNKSFALDEEYVLNVLVEVCNSSTLNSKKEYNGNVFKARLRSLGLKSSIANSLIFDDGKQYFKPEYVRINRIMEKIAFGLYFKRYKVFSNISKFNCIGFYPYSIVDLRPTEIFLLTYTEKFSIRKWQTVQKNVMTFQVVKNWKRANKTSLILNIHNAAWAIIEIPAPPNRAKRITSKRQLCLLFPEAVQ